MLEEPKERRHADPDAEDARGETSREEWMRRRKLDHLRCPLRNPLVPPSLATAGATEPPWVIWYWRSATRGIRTRADSLSP